MEINAPVFSSDEFKELLIFIFCGPSGCGKTTLIDELLRQRPVLRKAVSSTSRAPRVRDDGSGLTEEHGVDYYYYTRAAFEARAASGHFAEYDTFAGNLYGLEFGSIKAAGLGKKAPVKDVTYPGAQNILRLFPRARLIYPKPRSLDEIALRMKKRGTPLDVIVKRLEQAEIEMKVCPGICHHTIDSVDGRIPDIVAPQALKIIDPYLQELAAV